MAINSSLNPKFQTYVKHVLKWEGSMDDDPRDHAKECVKGLTNVAKRGKKGLPIHTVKGVTYCVFKKDAARLGITPVSHARFVTMTEADAAKFIFDTYKNKPWKNTKDAVGIALTETAWGSGDGRVWPTVIDTLTALNVSTLPKKNTLNYTAAEKASLINDINKVGESNFVNKYHEIRTAWLDRLGQTAYGAPFRRGWLNRQNDFKKLIPRILTPQTGGLFFLALVATVVIFRKKLFGK